MKGMDSTMVTEILKYSAELQNNYSMTFNMGGIIFRKEMIPVKKKMYIFSIVESLILKFKKYI